MGNINLQTEITALYPELKKYARSLLFPDIQEAEDLLNDTVERILRKVDLFEEGANFRAWCYSIMKNNFINLYRKRVRIRENMPEVELDSERAISKISHQEADDDIRFEQLMAVVKQLPKNQKEAFLLMFDGYQYDEIAEKLQIPIGTVKSRIFLARKTLMEKVEKENDKVKELQKQQQINNYIMAPQAKDKTEALKAFFAEIFETNGNHWVSVKDKPLIPIQRKHGLDHNWGGPINKTMAATQWFSVEGERGGMRYRCFNATIPDYNQLAEMTIRFRKEALEAYSKSDTKPIQHKTTLPKSLVEKTTTTTLPKRKFFNLEETVFLMSNNQIERGVVIGVEKINEGHEDECFIHKVKTNSDIFEGKTLNEIFVSPELLVEALFFRMNKKYNTNYKRVQK